MRGSISSLVVLYLALACISAEKKIVCYYGSWAVYRRGLGKFDISDINPSLCTHLIYAFVGLNGTEVVSLDPWQDLQDNSGKNGFRRFNALRGKNPTLKTLVAIGGWNEGSEKYSKMASTGAGREAFVDSAVKFVRKWNFDGFDLDWEYPAQRGGDKSDVDNYIELLKLLRKRFDEEGLILSAAVAAAESSASKSYRIGEMSKYLDFINIMAYDFHTLLKNQTGINAPLYGAVEASVNYWLCHGAPKEKLNLGMPVYGRSYTLEDPKFTKIGAATQGPGKPGLYTNENGTLGYNEICEKLQKEDQWSVFYDQKGMVPYAVKGDQWISYDNIASFKKKAEYVKGMKLGGAMIWSLDTDDFRGICNIKYPMLKILNEVLRNSRLLKFSQVSSQLKSTANLILCLFLISVSLYFVFCPILNCEKL